MMTIRHLIIAIMTTSLLVIGGCTQGPHNRSGDPGSKQVVGAILGAAAGGFAGSELGGDGDAGRAAAAGGALGGMFVGGAIGKALDQQDKLFARRAARASAQTGRAHRWENPKTGNSGTVEPIRRTRDREAGRECITYKSRVQVDGKTRTGRGKACRNDNGRLVVQ